MLKRYIGRIDDTINFCPHCGKRLELVSVIESTKCQRCGNTFLVLETAKDMQANRMKASS